MNSYSTNSLPERIIVEKENELKVQQRSIENYTHFVDTDFKIKTVTSWRRSSAKFKISLIFNIFTFGIIHLISIFKPKLFIKLYCNKSHPINSDYFLIEDTYGYYTLCKRIFNKNLNAGKKSSTSSYDNFFSPSHIDKSNNNKRWLLFEYNHIKYEYDGQTKMLIPVYFNLNKKTNKFIFNHYGDGLTSETKVKNKFEKYGKNTVKMELDFITICLRKLEIHNIILSVVSLTLLIIFQEYIFGLGLLVMLSIIVGVKILHKYRTFYKIIKTNYTLLNKSDSKGYKVKRDYLNKEYELINCSEILPGDIIFLEEKDIVPCDAIILEGDCTISECYTLGKIGTLNKKALENNGNIFNYRTNNINIIFQGMKIIKVKAKDNINNKRIVVLSINTGPNTFIANQFLNLIYIFEENKNYLNLYNYFSGSKMYYFNFAIVVSVCYSIVIIFMYFKSQQIYIAINKINKKFGVLTYIGKIFAIGLMPMYQITSIIIHYLSVKILEKNNIQCVDESRLMEASLINTVIFDKNGTISENKIELKDFYPVYKEENNSNLAFKSYNKLNAKHINNELIQFYRNYYIKINKENYSKSPKTGLDDPNNFFTSRSKSVGSDFDKEKQNISQNLKKNIENDKIYKGYKLSTYFLECVICCNDIYKNNNNELAGNILEQEIFEVLKWDIKDSTYKEKETKQLISYNENKRHSSFCNQSGSILEDNDDEDLFNVFKNENIQEVFPKKYFKITEEINSNRNFKKIKNNFIMYKLKILKKFHTNSTFELFTITYNCFDKSLKFMIKSTAEKVIGNCIDESLPLCLENLLIFFRKEGYRVTAFAYKELSKKYVIDKFHGKVDEEEILNDLMEDLIFCGFIVFNNKLKKDTKKTIQTLQKMKCDTIISTGDSLNNTIGVGMKSGIINEKNLYSYDIDKDGKIYITNLIRDQKNILNETNYYDNQNEDNSIYDRSLDNLKNITTNNPKQKNKQNKNSSIDNIRSVKHKNKQTPTSTQIKNKERASLKEIKLEEDEKNSSQEKPTPKNFYKYSVNNDFKNQILNTPIIPKRNISKIQNKIFIKETKNKNLNSFNLSNDDLENNEDFEEYILNKQKDSFKKNSQNNIIRSPKKELKSNEKINKNQRPSAVNIKPRRREKSNRSITDILNKSNDTYGKQRNKSHKNSERPRFIQKKDTISKKNHYKLLKSMLSTNLFSYYYCEENLSQFKHHALFCISGNAFRYIFQEYKKNKKFIKLVKYLKYKCKIYHSMSPTDKSLLVDFYRSFPDKHVCMVGDGFNDIPAILSSEVGINIKKSKNLNTILCHFFTYDNDLSCVEKIIKNGRGIYESYYLLLDAVIIFVSLEMLLTFNCFYYQVNLGSARLLFINIAFSILSISAFARAPDYEINYDYLLNSKRCFMLTFHTIKIIGMMVIKSIIITCFGLVLKTNILEDKELQKKVTISYYYLIVFFMSMSAILTFNLETYYRKSIFENKIFIFLYFLIFGYLSFTLILSEKSFHLVIFDLLDFEYSNNNSDTNDDKKKITTISYVAFDCFWSIFYIQILKCAFGKKAEKIATEIQVKVKHE